MKKDVIGKIVSTKMQKTVVVMIERKFRHHLYKKTIVRHKKLKAQSEDEELKVGDMVKIRETRPISKDKHFIVIEKINSSKASSVAKEQEDKQSSNSKTNPKTKQLNI